MSEKTLGQVAYEAWWQSTDELPAAQRFENAAQAVAAEYERRKAARQAGWTLGKVAYEVHRLEPWEGVSEFGKERYEAMAQAVAEEVERRRWKPISDAHEEPA